MEEPEIKDIWIEQSLLLFFWRVGCLKTIADHATWEMTNKQMTYLPVFHRNLTMKTRLATWLVVLWDHLLTTSLQISSSSLLFVQYDEYFWELCQSFPLTGLVQWKFQNYLWDRTIRHRDLLVNRGTCKICPICIKWTNKEISRRLVDS